MGSNDKLAATFHPNQGPTMGQRPSQCPECGCFQACLNPSSPYCDAKLHGDPNDKQRNEIAFADGDEYKSARQSMSEMERAHDYDDMH